MSDVNILDRLHETVVHYPNKPALEIGSRRWSYSELWESAGEIANAIASGKSRNLKPVAIFASRSFTIYAGMLGALRSGRAYLPLNTKFPHSRTRNMLDMAGCDTAIVGEEFSDYYKSYVETGANLDAVILVDFSTKEWLDSITIHTDALQSHPKRTILSETWSPIAYVLFTSGTTGQPKGIPVSHSNLDAYIGYILHQGRFSEEDRFSQTFDATFDLSVHDIFICWSIGGCLCPLQPDDLLLPNKFINDKRLTAWFSVPSIALRMKHVRMLKPGSFPTLRYSAFCGEALPNHIAEDWQRASPNSAVFNLYGPTEATICIAEHKWQGERSIRRSANGIVPIGEVFSTHKHCIVDNMLRPVKAGSRGELLIAGPQVTNGYLHNTEKTAESFVRLDDSNIVWYRTGDTVQESNDGTIQFLGRIDNQVQIRGFRVEISEVEFVIRSIEDVIDAVVIPLQDRSGLTIGLRAFAMTKNDTVTSTLIINYCTGSLPDYMVPSQVTLMDRFPLNANGKVDRNKLAAGEFDI